MHSKGGTRGCGAFVPCPHHVSPTHVPTAPHAHTHIAPGLLLNKRTLGRKRWRLDTAQPWRGEYEIPAFTQLSSLQLGKHAHVQCGRLFKLTPKCAKVLR